ncbi:F-box protein SKIP19, partial [Trifolium medium]|nr:F-box protein SKIP19 [Trifolium medium]
DGDYLTNVGLLAILDKCPLLKSLHINWCSYIELSESLVKRCTDQINDLQLNPYVDEHDYSAGFVSSWGDVDDDDWF